MKILLIFQFFYIYEIWSGKKPCKIKHLSFTFSLLQKLSSTNDMFKKVNMGLCFFLVSLSRHPRTPGETRTQQHGRSKTDLYVLPMVTNINPNNKQKVNTFYSFTLSWGNQPEELFLLWRLGHNRVQLWWHTNFASFPLHGTARLGSARLTFGTRCFSRFHFPPQVEPPQISQPIIIAYYHKEVWINFTVLLPGVTRTVRRKRTAAGFVLPVCLTVYD